MNLVQFDTIIIDFSWEANAMSGSMQVCGAVLYMGMRSCEGAVSMGIICPICIVLGYGYRP